MAANGQQHIASDKDHMNGGGQPIGRTVTLSNEQFEKLYLQPNRSGPSDIRNRFGNPTIIGLIAFTVITTVVGMSLAGFAGDSSNLTIVVGVGYLFAGLGLWVAGIFELILGNTFPATVFMSYGSFWFSFAWILDPTKDTASSYAAGVEAAGYNNGLGLYLATWAFLTLLYTFIALRTNVALVWVLFWIFIVFAMLGSGYLSIAQGTNISRVPNLFKAGGAAAFIAALGGWWLIAAQLLASVGWRFSLPVGDLSGFMAPKSAV